MDDITDAQRKEIFESLPPEGRHLILKSFTDLVTKNIADRMRTLPTIASLFATLLIVATFNLQLLPLNAEVKILISIVMLLVPLSLFFYLINLIAAEKSGIKYFEAWTGKPGTVDKLAAETTIYSKIIGVAPIGFTIIIYLLVNDILRIMWGWTVGLAVFLIGALIFYLFSSNDFDKKLKKKN